MKKYKVFNLIKLFLESINNLVLFNFMNSKEEQTLVNSKNVHLNKNGIHSFNYFGVKSEVPKVTIYYSQSHECNCKCFSH